MPGQALATIDFERTDDGYRDQATLTEDISTANLITSKVEGTERHKPVLDIDLPVKLLPSSTPGHFHLLIDHEMSWETYCYLLDALVIAGVVQPGYADASRAEGFTCVRLPWVRKAVTTS